MFIDFNDDLINTDCIFKVTRENLKNNSEYNYDYAGHFIITLHMKDGLESVQHFHEEKERNKEYARLKYDLIIKMERV